MDKTKQTIQKQNAYLNKWALGVLGADKKSKPHTRRLSYKEAWLRAQKIRLYRKHYGHYPKV